MLHVEQVNMILTWYMLVFKAVRFVSLTKFESMYASSSIQAPSLTGIKRLRSEMLQDFFD